MNIRELRAQRTKLGADAAAIMDAATAASRSMTGEEENQFDNLLEERDKLDATIERAVRLREEDREEAGRQEPEPGTGDAAAMTALRAYFLGGRASSPPRRRARSTRATTPRAGTSSRRWSGSTS